MKSSTWSKKKRLAAAGGLAAVSLACAAFMIYGYVSGARPKGPSELTLHPEKQDTIVAERRAAQFKERLGLTDDQTEQLAQMLQRFRNEMREQRKQMKGEPAERLALGRAKVQGFADQLRGMLTEEQQAKFDALRADRTQRMDTLRGMLLGNSGKE